MLIRDILSVFEDFDSRAVEMQCTYAQIAVNGNDLMLFLAVFP